MEQHYQKMIKDTEDRVVYSLWNQEKRKDSPLYGGFYDKDRKTALETLHPPGPKIASCYLETYSC